MNTGVPWSSSMIKSTAFKVPEMGVWDVLMSLRMPVEVSPGCMSSCWRVGATVRGMESMAKTFVFAVITNIKLQITNEATIIVILNTVKNLAEREDAVA